jgi:outer membrane lipoprotein-sorting protein
MVADRNVRLVGLIAAALPALLAHAAAADATGADPTGAAAAAITPPVGDPDLLARISAQAKTLTTVAGTFTQQTTGTDGDAPKLITGTFAIEAPDKYSVVESRPDDADWHMRQWSDGEGHWQSEQQLPGIPPDISPQHGDADLERVIACLRGDFTAVGVDYAVSALPGDSATGNRPAAGATILLTPHADSHDLPVRIVLDHDFHAVRVDLDQPGGQHIAVTVTAATYGRPSPDGSFTPPPPQR